MLTNLGTLHHIKSALDKPNTHMGTLNFADIIDQAAPEIYARPVAGKNASQLSI